MESDQLLLQSNRADQVQEERLAGPVVTDHESDRGSAVGDAIEIGDQRFDLGRAPDLDMVLSRSGHDACAQRLQERVALLRANAGDFGHASNSFMMSRSIRTGSSPSATGAPHASKA